MLDTGDEEREKQLFVCIKSAKVHGGRGIVCAVIVYFAVLVVRLGGGQLVD